MIYILTYVILGIILATIGLSLFNGIAELIETLFEYFKYALAVKIAEYNVKINELAEDKQEDSTRAIGFTISKEEDDIDYE